MGFWAEMPVVSCGPWIGQGARPRKGPGSLEGDFLTHKIEANRYLGQGSSAPWIRTVLS